MAHGIKAIIGEHAVVQRLEDDFILAKEIELPQQYGMIFLTASLAADIGELFESADEPSDFGAVTSYLLQEYSFRAKLAYIEIDYEDGVRTQTGLLYENGKLRFAPRSGEGVINLLLRELGVWREKNKDEFDSLHLGRYRRMDKWLL